MTFIGAENIISPLGSSAHETFKQVREGKTALKSHDQLFSQTEPSLCGIIENYEGIDQMTKLESLMIQCLRGTLSQVKIDFEKTIVVFSTTKGDIEYLIDNEVDKAKPSYLLNRVMGHLGLEMDTLIVSNACISGVLAVIQAHDLIQIGKYENAIVIGADLVTEFTYRGFESFFALSEKPCKPFDESRTGLNLGEAIASVALSKSTEVFTNEPLIFKGGASANDANHISGPSRTGEGLYRAISSCYKQAGLSSSDIDFISAHGTATKYNDDMESIAFTRHGLGEVPTNSFKGYFGHTLGAAGVLEIVLTMQSMRAGELIKNMGGETPGTTEDINIIIKNQPKEINNALKTASGFGGCNAAAIIQKKL